MRHHVNKATFGLATKSRRILSFCLILLQTGGHDPYAQAPLNASRTIRGHSATDVVVDSAISLEDALKGSNCPPYVSATLTLINVEYWGFDKRRHRGQLVVHRGIAQEAKDIFQELLRASFPIKKVIPIVRYRWVDGASMADNNTSAFNYRYVPGTQRLSRHAYGRALDINPSLNPYMLNGVAHPRGAKYNVTVPGTIQDNYVVAAFEKRGWRWGGRWREKDWQHFDKQR